MTGDELGHMKQVYEEKLSGERHSFCPVFFLQLIKNFFFVCRNKLHQSILELNQWFLEDSNSRTSSMS